MNLVSIVLILILSVNSVINERSDFVASKSFLSLTKALIDSSNDLSFVSDNNLTRSSILQQTFAGGIPVTVKQFAKAENTLELNSSAIVSMESIGNLQAFNEKVVLTNKYTKPLQFFIHCKDATIDQLSKLEESDKSKAIFQYEYFVVDLNESILLMTFVWHTAAVCN